MDDAKETMLWMARNISIRRAMILNRRTRDVTLAWCWVLLLPFVATAIVADLIVALAGRWIDAILNCPVSHDVDIVLPCGVQRFSRI